MPIDSPIRLPTPCSRRSRSRPGTRSGCCAPRPSRTSSSRSGHVADRCCCVRLQPPRSPGCWSSATAWSRLSRQPQPPRRRVTSVVPADSPRTLPRARGVARSCPCRCPSAISVTVSPLHRRSTTLQLPGPQRSAMRPTSERLPTCGRAGVSRNAVVDPPDIPVRSRRSRRTRSAGARASPATRSTACCSTCSLSAVTCLPSSAPRVPT